MTFWTTYFLYPYWWTTTSSRHWSQITTAFRLVSISGRSTHSAVHRRRQSVSCRGRPSVEQSPQSHVTSAPSLSIFRSRLKFHLFSVSYPNIWLTDSLHFSLVQCLCSDFVISNTIIVITLDIRQLPWPAAVHTHTNRQTHIERTQYLRHSLRSLGGDK